MNTLNKIKKFICYKIKEPVYIPILYGEMLKNKNILIVGGSSGIGYAIADVAIKNKANIVIAGRDEKKLNSAKKKLLKNNNDIGIVEIYSMDISKVKNIYGDINNIANLFKENKIDILICSAGIAGGNVIGTTKESEYEKIIDNNLKGTYFLSQEIANYFEKNKIKGNILIISSVSGIRPAISPYMISKWGINGLIKGLAKKYIKSDIVVNGIAPGPTITDMIEHESNNLNYENSPAKRYLDTTEVANLAIYMVSDFGRMIVGDIVNISGGCGNLTFDDITY